MTTAGPRARPGVSSARIWSRNAHEIVVAADAIDSLVDDFDHQMSTVNRAVSDTMDRWRGDVANASVREAVALQQMSNRLGIGILDIADRLNDLGPDLVRAATVAAGLADHLAALGYLVTDDGAVRAPADPTAGFPVDIPAGIDGGEADRLALSRSIVHQTDLTEALDALATADAALAEQIALAARDLELLAQPITTAIPLSADVADVISGRRALPADPVRLNRWWSTLTAGEKAALWDHDRRIGNTDGIPAADRDHFNRRHLDELQLAARRRIDALADTEPTRPRISRGEVGRTRAFESEHRRWQERMTAAGEQARGYDAVAATIEPRCSPEPTRPRLLMLVADNRAVVAVNNPDTAAHVATYVPGTDSDMHKIGGGIDRAERTLAAIARIAPTTDASVIVWQGYDTPDDLVQAASIDPATRAATPLEQFQTGLRATHDGATPSHATVIGHSYGTTVIGQAATGDRGLDADDVVLVASPGVGVDHASDLRLNGMSGAESADHVWATMARNDPLRLANLAVDAMGVPDRTRDAVFGVDPASVGFGGHVFAAAPGDLGDVAVHSQYWQIDNPALEALARIVVGRGPGAF